MELKKNNGFTLIEVIVVAAIIAILAGILVPMIFNQVDEAKKARALADCKSIANSIMLFRKDTGDWPQRSAGGATGYAYLTGTGNDPVFAGLGATWATAPFTTLTEHLINNPPVYAYPNWKGPYMVAIDADPWGNKYIINVADFTTTNAVYVYSAGPDGTMDTAPGFAPDPAISKNIAVKIK